MGFIELDVVVKAFIFVGFMVGGLLFGLWYQGKLALLIPIAGAAILATVMYAGGPDASSSIVQFLMPIGAFWTLAIIRWLIPRRFIR